MKLFYLNQLLILIVILWGGITDIKAQGFVYLEDTVSSTGPSDAAEFVSHNYIVNQSENTLSLTWERIQNELPDQWNTSVCDINLCYDSEISTADFQLAPGDTGNIDVHFRPFGQTGNGKVRVRVFQTNFGAAADTAFFEGQATTPTAMVSDPVNKTEINFYPNPVDEYLNITFSGPANYKVEIYNVLGKNVVDKTVKNTNYTRIYFDKFPNGVYLLTVKDETTGQRITKRFTKE